MILPSFFLQLFEVLVSSVSDFKSLEDILRKDLIFNTCDGNLDISSYIIDLEALTSIYTHYCTAVVVTLR